MSLVEALDLPRLDQPHGQMIQGVLFIDSKLPMSDFICPHAHPKKIGLECASSKIDQPALAQQLVVYENAHPKLSIFSLQQTFPRSLIVLEH